MSDESHTTPAGTDNQSSIFFWRETDKDYGFLCQWYLAPFKSDQHPGITFNCAEQYMMYQKGTLAGETEVCERILTTAEPEKQKELGRSLKTLDAKQWDRIKFDIVVEGNVRKFSDNPHLRESLLATDNRELVEASPSDRVWGIGFLAKYAEEQRASWGQNLLGKALMTVREMLRDAES
ncbi:MAG: hypothetical protein Q9218_004113 [Villophora microphyllina]